MDARMDDKTKRRNMGILEGHLRVGKQKREAAKRLVPQKPPFYIAELN